MFSNLTRVEIIMLVVPAALFAGVLELVRRRKLREDYSLLWLVTFGVLVFFAVFPNSLLDGLADLMGIFYPPAALFVVGFGLMLIVLLQFSLVITRLAQQNKQSAQRLALLSARVRELEQQVSAPE
jgi:hypothetical protein